MFRRFLAADLLPLCLRRIAELEADVRAWVEVAPQPATGEGPLTGIPFGAKDIFETRGLATEYGSPLYAGRKGECDAAVIAGLRRAGAVLLGKTHTTAFASFDPAPTRNPRLPGHTPGGSSSGSAAAVAAGMVPFALGTQTLGSVLRPASYCGVCGFKPTFGLIPVEGVLPFAPSLDTVGFFTGTAADMAWLWARGFRGRSSAQLHRAALFGVPAGEPMARARGFSGRSAAQLHRAALFRVPAEEPMARAIDAAAEKLRAAGVRVDAVDLPEGWDRLTAAARAINDYEGARTHAARYRQFGEGIGRRLAELVRRGLEMSEQEFHEARACVESLRGAVASVFWEYPAILSPAATGPAPAGFDSTGDPANNAPWTALGVPAIGIPLVVEGAPLGLQITAAWGRDDALVAMAEHAEQLLAVTS